MASNKCDMNCENEETNVLHNLSDVEKEIMKFRVGLDLENLCDKHYRDQFIKYTSWHSRKCADPRNEHKKSRKTGLVVITLETARNVKNYTEYRVIPGQSVCRTCLQYLSDLVEESMGAHEKGGSVEVNMTADEDPSV